MTPTPEQSAILALADQPTNLMIVARAGTGKTATLEMIDWAIDGPHLLVCFNKSVAEEAQRRVRSTTTVRTFNSIGHRIWAQACAKKLALDSKKRLNIFRQLADAAPKPARQELWKRYDAVSSGVDMARAIGYIPDHHVKVEKRLADQPALSAALDESPDDETLRLIDEILTISIRQAYDGIVDFADQVYMPALFGGTYPRFPLVLIDEYQDLSPINHAMVAKLCRHSRQIGVGDDAQAIYGFRGAMEDSMAIAIRQFEMKTLPLSISFRCPSTIVENVLWRVPEFRASRTGGIVEEVDQIDDGEASIICRNNAPLFSIAIKLLVAGRKVDVAGVDLSTRLVNLLGKLGEDELSQNQSLSAIDSWLADREAAESKTAADTAECMRVFVRQAKTLAEAKAIVKHLATQTGPLRFLTGHKAKGLEWDHVYHLDSWLLRNGQDLNLHYVCDTRAKERLSYIDSKVLNVRL